jgi:hypothetical protein
MIARLFGGVALLGILCSAAFAQNMTLSKGQMMTVGSDGKITISTMPTDAKAIKAMMHKGRAMKSGGTAVMFMNDKGNLESYYENYHESSGHGN